MPINKNRRLKESLKKFSKKKEEKVVTIAGELGLPLNGQKLVEVPNRKGFVFVRLRNNTSEVIQAYNSEVSTIYGLAVLVARQNNIYKVIGRDLDRYRDWGNIPYLPKHGGQHSFNPALGMGADIVWTYSSQFMPLLGYPSGTDGSNNITVGSYIIRDINGNWKYVGNTGTPDISIYRPSVETGAVMVLVYIDTVSGNPYLLVGSGTMFHSGLTGTADITPYIPQVNNPNWIPDTAIRLTTGTTQLMWTNLYDVRPFFQVVPTGTSGGGGGGGGGGSFGQIGVMVQDEGVPLGTGTTLNFVGGGVDVSISGTVARIHITGSSNTSACSTYSMATSPTQLGGSIWQVPNRVYASGSLAYFYNGLLQCKGTDYEELIYVSGTFQLLFTPATGSCHMVMYGVPCTTQSYSPTGGVNALIDSNGVLMMDSNGIQLTDSNG